MRVDPTPVQSVDDPRTFAFTQLTDMDLRRKIEPASGVFMAEGMLVIERCVSAGFEIISVLTAAKWLDRLGAILSDVDVNVYVADETTLGAITGFTVHRGALAAVRRPREDSVHDILGLDGDVLVLEALVDPTNVGLAIRSAVCQGISLAIVSPECADPLYRRAVKASMGTVLRCRWARSDDWPATLSALRARGDLIALTPDADKDLETALRSCSGSIALIVGSEGPGLSDAVLTAADHQARVPMAAPGDSLNVAAAAAVACYERARTRTRTMTE
jgi:tRNA G18 (ribose-2'-O)-methylase SpoU